MQINDDIFLNDIHVNSAIIDERNSHIEQIYKDSVMINEIYTDLALLVQQQGESINIIADNIEHCVTQTEEATRELEKASKFQKKRCAIS